MTVQWTVDEWNKGPNASLRSLVQSLLRLSDSVPTVHSVFRPLLFLSSIFPVSSKLFKETLDTIPNVWLVALRDSPRWSKNTVLCLSISKPTELFLKGTYKMTTKSGSLQANYKEMRKSSRLLHITVFEEDKIVISLVQHFKEYSYPGMYWLNSFVISTSTNMTWRPWPMFICFILYNPSCFINLCWNGSLKMIYLNRYFIYFPGIQSLCYMQILGRQMVRHKNGWPWPFQILQDLETAVICLMGFWVLFVILAEQYTGMVSLVITEIDMTAVHTGVEG